MNDIFGNDNEKLKEHFKKVDKLVKYYMDNMDNEYGTIQEALEYLFGELGTHDLNRAIEELKIKQRRF
jgi:hypothetical protein